MEGIFDTLLFTAGKLGKSVYKYMAKTRISLKLGKQKVVICKRYVGINKSKNLYSRINEKFVTRMFMLLLIVSLVQNV